MKICTCGNKLTDDARFCTVCGADATDFPVVEEEAGTTEDAMTAFEGPTEQPPMEEMTEAPVSEGTPETQEVPAPEAMPVQEAPAPASAEKKAGKKGKVIFILIVILLALILIVTGSILIYTRFFGGYRTPIRKVFKYINAHEMDEVEYMELMLPSFATDTYVKLRNAVAKADPEYDEQLSTGTETILNGFYDLIADTYNDDYVITYEIVSAKELTSNQLKSISKLFSEFGDETLSTYDVTLQDSSFYELVTDYFNSKHSLNLTKGQHRKIVKLLTAFGNDLENVKVTDGYEVTIRYFTEFTDSYGDENKLSNRITFNVIKVNGHWYLDTLSYLNDRSIYSGLEEQLGDFAGELY